MNIEEIADDITDYYYACEDYSEDELYTGLQEAGEFGIEGKLLYKIVHGAVYMALEQLVNEEGNEWLKGVLAARKSENTKFPKR